MQQSGNEYPFEIEEALGFLMNRAGRLMARRLHELFEQQGHGMPREQWPVLIHLWLRDGRYQQELADHICRDKGTIARVLEAMEVDNLIVRVQDERDKRQKRVFLTHKGKNLRTELLPLAQRLSAQAANGISEADLHICRKVLKKVYENLLEA